MTFAPGDLLAGIITARAASLRGLDALAVDDRGRRTGFAPDPLAIRYHQRMVDLLEQAGIAPVGSVFACLMSAEMTVCVSLLAIFIKIT